MISNLQTEKELISSRHKVARMWAIGFSENGLAGSAGSPDSLPLEHASFEPARACTNTYGGSTVGSSRRHVSLLHYPQQWCDHVPISLRLIIIHVQLLLYLFKIFYNIDEENFVPMSTRQFFESRPFSDLMLKITGVILIFDRQSSVRVVYLSDVIRFLDHRVLSLDHDDIICSAF